MEGFLKGAVKILIYTVGWIFVIIFKTWILACARMAKKPWRGARVACPPKGGGMTERLKVPHSKCGVLARVP